MEIWQSFRCARRKLNRAVHLHFRARRRHVPWLAGISLDQSPLEAGNAVISSYITNKCEVTYSYITNKCDVTYSYITNECKLTLTDVFNGGVARVKNMLLLCTYELCDDVIYRVK